MLLRAAKLLEDMRMAGTNILHDVEGRTFQTFLSDRWFRQVCERNFEILGEAMRRLTGVDRDLAERITGSRDVIDLRNVIIHNYDRVDPATLWLIIETTLPALVEEVEAFIAEFDAQDDGAIPNGADPTPAG